MPSGIISLAELALGNTYPDGITLSFFGWLYDMCNNVKYTLIFLMGYAIMQADEQGMEDVIRKSRWYNFIIGKLQET